jgi:hypothetical protein
MASKFESGVNLSERSTRINICLGCYIIVNDHNDYILSKDKTQLFDDAILISPCEWRDLAISVNVLNSG